MKTNIQNPDNENISFYLDEIKSMRDEINWRVKMAYTGSLIFLSAITIALSSLFNSENTIIYELKKNPDILTIVGIVCLLAISAWAGVQNANHIIEKRIELYTLDLMNVVFSKSKHPHASWLGYLYGNPFFGNKIPNSISKTLNASIGFFIYFLPNLIALIGWFAILKYGKVRDYLIWFCFATLFVFVAVCSTIMFFIYVNKVNKLFTKFYKNKMKNYFQEFR